MKNTLNQKLINIINNDSIKNKIFEVLKVLNLKNDDFIEICPVNNENADYIIKVAQEAHKEKVPIFSIKRLNKTNIQDIERIQKYMWNYNKIPISLYITPTDIILRNNFTIKKNSMVLNSLQKSGIVKFDILEYKNIINGKFNIVCESIIKNKERVDQHLLKNIRIVLNMLCNNNMSFSTAHDFLSKSIFIKYLEDRQIITKNTYSKFNAENYVEVLERPNLIDFYKYMEVKFGGDIFFSDENIPSEKCKKIVIDFLNGTDLETGQLSIFGYDFSVIPIELLSNIYEMFLQEEDVLKKKSLGAFYTPYYLANTIINNSFERLESKKDGILILDPACGSGVFLVSAFKKIASKFNKTNDATLINVLQQSIFGIDINENALKITKLSLYIALLDCFEPKDIEDNDIRLPDMKQNLIRGDFFDNNFINLKFDLIVGNPPWTSKLSESCKRYLKNQYNNIVSDNQLCQAFILRIKDYMDHNSICSVLITNGILYNSNARKFRKTLLSNFKLIEVFNLQKLKTSLFENAKYPCSVITLSINNIGENYICNYVNVVRDFFDILQNTIYFDKSNSQKISYTILKKYDFIWTILHEGNILDFELIYKLKYSNNNMSSFLNLNNLFIGQGYSKGNKIDESFLKLKECCPDYFTRYKIEYNRLKHNKNKAFERLHDVKQYFSSNKLLIKRTIRKNHPECAYSDQPLFYNNDFYCIFSMENNVNLNLYFLEAIINSDLYNYYQFHMSPSYNKTSKPEIRMDSIKSFPIPQTTYSQLKKITDKVKNIHVIIEKYNIESLQNIDNKQINFLDMKFDKKLYIDAVNDLNNEIYNLYSISNQDRIIINNSIKYLIKKEPYPERFNSGKYLKILLKELRLIMPGKYNIYVSQETSRFYDMITIEISNKKTATNVQHLNQIILNNYESLTINDLFNNVVLRKSFIGTFYDGFFIIKNKNAKNWQEINALLDIKKIQGFLFGGEHE